MCKQSMYRENREGMGVGEVLAKNRAEPVCRFQTGRLSSGVPLKQGQEGKRHSGLNDRRAGLLKVAFLRFSPHYNLLIFTPELKNKCLPSPQYMAAVPFLPQAE